MNARTNIDAPTPVPAGANALGDGIVVGSGPMTVDAYIDFLCPFSRRFEAGNGTALKQMVDEQLITLIYHPLAFLDRLSTTAYSTRSSSASGCASDGGRFADYKDALFANQPREGGPGLSDEELIALGMSVGLHPDFARCVPGHAYLDWTAYVTARAIQRGVNGTPTTLFEGRQVQPDAREIASAVDTAIS
jgi:protein-disulfide isomerase